MSVRIGINGFGRIGKLTLRSALQNNGSKVKIAAINNPAMSLDYAVYMLRYDSVHGKFTKIFLTLSHRKVPWRSYP